MSWAIILGIVSTLFVAVELMRQVFVGFGYKIQQLVFDEFVAFVEPVAFVHFERFAASVGSWFELIYLVK